jgi:hypothetical protein
MYPQRKASSDARIAEIRSMKILDQSSNVRIVGRAFMKLVGTKMVSAQPGAADLRYRSNSFLTPSPPSHCDSLRTLTFEYILEPVWKNLGQ